ncbi:MAG: hypothetical protein QM296_09470 [Bacillota bacterium]|nr:hypothetical protein [Bacillota bacterium]
MLSKRFPIPSRKSALVLLLLLLLFLTFSFRSTLATDFSDRTDLDSYLQLAALRDEAFDKATIDDFTKTHYPTSGMPSFDKIQFAGAFYDPVNLDQVRLRIYHVLSGDQIVGCFYTNPYTAQIEQVGNSASPIFSLLDRLSVLQLQPKEIRFAISGLDEILLVKTEQDRYLIASILAPQAPELLDIKCNTLAEVENWFYQQEESYNVWKKQEKAKSN